MYETSPGVVDELSDMLPSNNAGNIMYLPFTASLILNLIKSFASAPNSPFLFGNLVKSDCSTPEHHNELVNLLFYLLKKMLLLQHH